MSNALAIAAVSECLKKLIEDGIQTMGAAPGQPAGASLAFELPFELREPLSAGGTFPVQLKPPYAIKDNESALCLFLYQVAINPFLRNEDFPGRTLPGQRGRPALSLNLTYLVTPIDAGFSGAREQRVLGQVMSILHDHPVFTRKDLVKLGATAKGIDQVDKVKFTLPPPDDEKMSKLWSSMQAKYRLSVVYEASVVLIESLLPTPSALPVISRGRESPDGFDVTPAGAFSSLVSARFPYPGPPRPGERALRELAFGRVGDFLLIVGQALTADQLTLVFHHSRQETPIEKEVLLNGAGMTRDDQRVVFPVPEDSFPAGPYTVAARLKKTGAPASVVTNEIPFSLAPEPIIQIKNNANDTIRVLEIYARPHLLKEQNVSIFLNDHEVKVGPVGQGVLAFWIYLKGAGILTPAQETTLVNAGVHFIRDDLKALFSPPREYWIRLRVDGADSLLVDPASEELAYDRRRFQRRLPDGPIDPVRAPAPTPTSPVVPLSQP